LALSKEKVKREMCEALNLYLILPLAGAAGRRSPPPNAIAARQTARF